MNRNEISLKKKINFTADSLRKKSFVTKREINYFVFTEKKDIFIALKIIPSVTKT